LVTLAALSVFILAFILDTGAVARLLWGALTGHFGAWIRIAAFGIVSLLCCVIALVLYSAPRQPSARVRQKATRPAIRTDAHIDRNNAKDIGSAGGAPVAKRGRKKTTDAAADRPV
jgi:uncharacterized membrane protein